MTPDQIAQILEDHAKWRRGDGGSRANLYGANLYGASLGGASLGGADLYGADLYGADLGGADLGGANLGRVNLGGANLSGANLGRVNLGGANLGGADLGGADLGGANLGGANLSDINLSCSRGVIWAQVGPIGTDRRTLTGVWVDGEMGLHAGCFHGSLAGFLEAVEAGGDSWEWPDDCEALKAECVEAAWYVQRRIHAQLEQVAS